MKHTAHVATRAILHEYEDGLTIPEISSMTRIHQDTIRKALDAMPDVYIDRWARSPVNNAFISVWCAVKVPENCPRPE